VLAVIRAQFAVDWTRPGWIEDELVRRGARDAHLVGDDVVSVTVVASSRREAEELVEDLLIRVGATPLGIVASEAERAIARA
jgi:hypothetical protein